MARQWGIHGVQIYEDGVEEYGILGMQLNEDQAAGFDSIRADIIAGLDGDLDTATSWDTIKASIPVTAVTRESPTQVKIVIPVLGSYDIVEQETITATVPASALVLGDDPVEASPQFTIAEVAGVTCTLGGTIIETIDEDDITEGGRYIYLDLINDTWISN